MRSRETVIPEDLIGRSLGLLVAKIVQIPFSGTLNIIISIFIYV